ncbi:MAG: extensin family protein [Alphaproteobacteria bacterium]|nr:extensin family protein [Alphaproteobacteria bacterium]
MVRGRETRKEALFALILLLAGCGSGPERRTGLPTSHVPASAQARQCLADLRSTGVHFSPLPDQYFGGGCQAINSVKLLDIGTPVTNLGAMTCPLASKFAGWARYGAQPAARLILGSELVRIETYGTYACRNINGNISGNLSEHAHSNAVDVAAFVLADGRRISVRDGWQGDDRARQFLRVIHDSACKRFRTVLSPDYNAAHRDHFHFDMGGKGTYCR